MLSEDSKWRIVKAYEKGEKVKEIARCFGINPSSVYDILKQYKETGNVEIRTYKRGRKQKLTAEQLEQIRKAEEERRRQSIVHFYDQIDRYGFAGCHSFEIPEDCTACFDAAVIIAAGPVITGMVKYLYLGCTCILTHLDESHQEVGVGVSCKFRSAIPTDIGLDYYFVTFLNETADTAQLLHCCFKHGGRLAVHDCSKVCIAVGCRNRT